MNKKIDGKSESEIIEISYGAVREKSRRMYLLLAGHDCSEFNVASAVN